VARGQDTRHHPGRVASNWKPVTGHTNTVGNVVSNQYVGEDPYEHRLEVTQGRKSPGFSADVDYVEHVGYHGTDTSNYRAGPFRTQRRAEIAAESLHNRAESGKDLETYKVGSYHESADERRANAAGLL
jgi:hypothetical protein